MSDNPNPNHNLSRLFAVRSDLNTISPSMCMAKWTQSTLYLFNGFTHSCHHPGVHKIDASRLLSNPTALHNTPQKMEFRQQMLDGKRPDECDYCWKIEDLGTQHLSDRVYKSANLEWGFPHWERVLKSGVGETFFPTYLEVAFESTCNFKCAYCMPEISSRWWEEIEQHGSYKLQGSELNSLDWVRQQDKMPFKRDEHNPYIEAFWKWWPELYQKLNTFRITGGEPLLSEHTWKVLEYVIDNPNPNIEICINTNLGVPSKLIHKLTDTLARMDGKCKRIQIYTSLESTGPQAEYARFGMVYLDFVENVVRVLSRTDTSVIVNFMTTINVLSASTLRHFLENVLLLRREYNWRRGSFEANRVGIMLSYLRWPEFLNLRILPEGLKAKYSLDWSNFLRDNHIDKVSAQYRAYQSFAEEAMQNQLKRLIAHMMEPHPTAELQRTNLHLFHTEYDRRRGTDFAATFPELADI